MKKFKLFTRLSAKDDAFIEGKFCLMYNRATNFYDKYSKMRAANIFDKCSGSSQESGKH